MVIFSGYGLIIVLMDYFGGIFLLSKLSPYLFATEKQQYLALIAFHVIITFINYYLARFLNRKEIRHTVYGGKLEMVVLIAGVACMALILMMSKDILY